MAGSHGIEKVIFQGSQYAGTEPLFWHYHLNVHGSGGPHHLPHFHAYYQDAAAVIGLDPIELIAGALLKKQLRLVELAAPSRCNDRASQAMGIVIVSFEISLSPALAHIVILFSGFLLSSPCGLPIHCRDIFGLCREWSIGKMIEKERN